jgi:phosphoglycolate phosphatase
MPRYRLVILDFDGTLADSGDWFLSIADHLAERFRFRRVDAGDVEWLRGMSSRDVIRYLGIPRWKLPGMAKYIRRLLGEQLHHIALFEGVTAMVDALVQSGVRIALVTSNAEANARAILGPRLAAQIDWFECGTSLFGKAPRFKKVIKQSNVAPEHVLAIGDETRDIVAARKVGVDAAAVLWGYANRDVLMSQSPDILFESPNDVVRTVLDTVA